MHYCWYLNRSTSAPESQWFLKLDVSRKLEVCSLIFLLLAGVSAFASLHPVDLRCEYLTNPIGIDEPSPRLSWRLESQKRGAKQTAYRVLVAGSEESLRAKRGDLWDSGEVASDETINIPYAGHPLNSRQTCLWKVCVSDESGHARWSKPALWRMALLNTNDWHAEFISFKDASAVWTNKGSLKLPSARQYRKEFSSAKPIRKATLYATALGIYEVHLNGQRVGDAFFAPGWCDYRQRLYYNTYDVTPLITKGANAIGAWVADGWYSGYLGFGLLIGLGPEAVGRNTYGKIPAFRAQLEIEYSDGTCECVVTDRSWKVSGHGPIREADFLMGESYDARLETPGWSKPGFDDSGLKTGRQREHGRVRAGRLDLTLEVNDPVDNANRALPVEVVELRPAGLELERGERTR